MHETREEVLQFQRDSSQRKAPAEREAIMAAGVCRAVVLAKLGSPVKGRMLCVGPRDVVELELLDALWGCESVGIDLFSQDPRIEVGDMGRMRFDSSTFAAVLSCHSLEHSFDPLEALTEMVRVLKVGGQLFVEVPYSPASPLQRFPSGADRWNFGSIENLVHAIPGVRVTYRNESVSALQVVAVKA